jgi:hypothetical protein
MTYFVVIGTPLRVGLVNGPLAITMLSPSMVTFPCVGGEPGNVTVHPDVFDVAVNT